MKAWYFAPPNEKLAYGDDRAIKVGHSHSVKETPVLCNRGLHGSVKMLDALRFAKSPILYRVDITRKVQQGKDKICGQRRKYLYRVDITSVLEEFARKQALLNIEKVKPLLDSLSYDLLVEYLTTGNKELKAAAYSAANSAANSAARSAAYYTARSAANYAANYAANSAANAANAAYYATYYAADSAAYSAAYSAANEMLESMVEVFLQGE